MPATRDPMLPMTTREHHDRAGHRRWVYVAFPLPLVRAWTGTDDRLINPLGRAIGVRDLAPGLGALPANRIGSQAQGRTKAADGQKPLGLADGALDEILRRLLADR